MPNVMQGLYDSIEDGDPDATIVSNQHGRQAIDHYATGDAAACVPDRGGDRTIEDKFSRITRRG